MESSDEQKEVPRAAFKNLTPAVTTNTDPYPRTMITSSLRLSSKVARLGVLLRIPFRPFSATIARMASSDKHVLGDDREKQYNVSIGTIIRGDEGDKFQPIRKLGSGINSTVWMVRNCSDEARIKYVALKILNRFATQEHESAPTNELQILFRTHIGKEPEHRPQVPVYDELGLPGPPHPGWYRVSGLIGYFTCDNGQHLVLVLPIYGEHMKDYMKGEPGRRLSPALAKQVAKELLEALDYLHSYCGVIHCDVKPENLLRDFHLGPQIDAIIEAVMKKEPNAGRDGRLAPLWVPHVDKPDKLHISLTDYSHATWKDFIARPPLHVGSPALKAPELVIGYLFSTAVDIWSFGCTIFELLAAESLFGFPDERTPNDLAQDPHYHLNLMQNLTGEPLFEEAAEGTLSVEKGFIGPDGWIKSPVVKSDTLDERIAKSLPELEDKDKFAAFLRRCLRIEPENRASASELMGDPWLASG